MTPDSRAPTASTADLDPDAVATDLERLAALEASHARLKAAIQHAVERGCCAEVRMDDEHGPRCILRAALKEAA